jgi:hypothetical protein
LVYRRGITGWTEDLRLRARYERDARAAYPDLHHRRVQRPSGPVHVYTVTLPVPGFDDRRITVEVESRMPSSPWIYADGPTDSPHRYGTHRLCVWDPADPPERRWVPEDGLLVLFAMISEHLFKEGYWRRNRKWLGDEAPHGPLEDKLDVDPELQEGPQ